MKEGMKRAVSILIILFISLLPVIVIGGIVAFIFASSSHSNDLKLNKFSSQLFNYPLPVNTKVLKNGALVGLRGNGNHCDYEATILIQTLLAKEDLEKYYDKIILKNADSQSGYRTVYAKPDIYVDEKGNDLYEIKITDIGYDPGLDMRCH